MFVCLYTGVLAKLTTLINIHLSAIRYATDLMFQTVRGDRPDVTNIAIVITDGEANRDTNLTTPEAIRARSKGIQVIAIGIGESVSVP